MLTASQKAWREKLTTALRSGEYKQAQGRLRAEAGFCCQGVGCDLVDSGAWTGDEGGGYNWKGPFVFVWPDEVRSKFGFSDDDSGELVNMNDGKRRGGECTDTATFDEIADAIDFLTLAGL